MSRVAAYAQDTASSSTWYAIMCASSSKMFNIIALPLRYSGTGENPPHYNNRRLSAR